MYLICFVATIAQRHCRSLELYVRWLAVTVCLSIVIVTSICQVLSAVGVDKRLATMFTIYDSIYSSQRSLALPSFPMGSLDPVAGYL